MKSLQDLFGENIPKLGLLQSLHYDICVAFETEMYKKDVQFVSMSLDVFIGQLPVRIPRLYGSNYLNEV